MQEVWKSGVVGDDLLPGHTITEPGGWVSWWRGHRSFFLEVFEREDVGK